MAVKHVRAVHAHSKATGRTYDVLKEIALDIGYNDEPMRTGIRTLAERVRCSVNSVGSAIKWGLAHGELKLAKVEGQRKYYALMLPTVPNATDTVYQPTVSPEKSTDTVSTSGTDTVLAEMTAELRRLTETVSILTKTVSPPYQSDSETVSVNRINRISSSHTREEVIEEKEEVLEVQEDHAHAHAIVPTESQLNGFSDYPANEAAIADALSQVTGIHPLLCNPNMAMKFDSAVKKLAQFQIPAQSILSGFLGENSYWYQASHGASKNKSPAIGNVLNEISIAQKWQPSTGNPDSKHSKSASAIDQAFADLESAGVWE